MVYYYSYIDILQYIIGAGIISILTLFWRNIFLNIHGFAYAVPAIFTSGICDIIKPHLTTILVGTDLVPRYI